jgi:7,8-dihydropterin-6-yl-methyl-4-(beta-D-ribofuranosyl)aminobenzene 5'-phosphate synthase
MRLEAMMVSLLAAGAPAARSAGPVEIRIVYDNETAEGDLRPDWGFAAAVDTGSSRILFDSGNDPEIFLGNLERLGIAPGSITHALISHAHADHLNGLYRFATLNKRMSVFFLAGFPQDVFEIAMAVGMAPRRVKGPLEIAPGVWSTGEVAGEPPEQALVIETGEGLVIMTGCSHPGVAALVEAARRARPEASGVRLLIGGFHMMRQNEAQIQAQIERLRSLGVRRVSPAHCTGERGKRLFRQAFGADCLPAGAGRVFQLE